MLLATHNLSHARKRAKIHPKRARCFSSAVSARASRIKHSTDSNAADKRPQGRPETWQLSATARKFNFRVLIAQSLPRGNCEKRTAARPMSFDSLRMRARWIKGLRSGCDSFERSNSASAPSSRRLPTTGVNPKPHTRNPVP